MKRYRVTLLVICLVLLYLGGSDLNNLRRNYQIQPISIAELEGPAPSQEWLAIDGGYVNLLEAISTTGSVEVSAFLVPLKISSDAQDYRVLLETRAPAIVDALKTYHFKLENEQDQQRYVQEHQELFFGRRDVSGMVMSGLISLNNQNRLAKLERDYGIDLPENVILFSENKEPARVRGFLFVGVALLGLIKLFSRWKKPAAPVVD
jgi:hypothetical protein